MPGDPMRRPALPTRRLLAATATLAVVLLARVPALEAATPGGTLAVDGPAVSGGLLSVQATGCDDGVAVTRLVSGSGATQTVIGIGLQYPDSSSNIEVP